MPSSEAIWQDGEPAIPPRMFNLAEHTLAHSSSEPEKTALELIHDVRALPERWSYGDLSAAVRGTMTGLLNQGLQPGDKLFLRLGNTLDFPILFLAAAGIGALPVPLSPMLRPREMQVMATLLTPKLVVCDEGVEAPVNVCVLTAADARRFRDLQPAPFARTWAEDPGYIILTSGTGGTSKAVVHAHRASFARRMIWKDWYGLTATDTMLHAGAFNWTFTLGTGLMDPWASGARALIYSGPHTPTIWGDLAERFNPTLFAAAPGVFRQVTKPDRFRPEQFASLRHGLSAGEALSKSVRDTWSKGTGKPILQALGMTEVSTYVSESPRSPLLYRPQRGRKVAILEENGAEPMKPNTPGRLAIATSDPGLMLGYWKNGRAELPNEGGWFVTGDRAEMREDGHITYHGRIDDLITSGGYRVAPSEVEKVLQAHPAVSEILVVALPIRKDVEVIAAFVTLHAPVAKEALNTHCAQQLAQYKIPRKFIIRDTLPRTARGKLDRRTLIAEHGWKADT